MLIACDGGAFQPGMSAGIRGCSIGFLNAAAALDPSFRVVLVADPRLGEIAPAALDPLTVRPEVIYAELSPACETPLRGLLTDNPDLRFIVDDIAVPTRRDGNWAWYDGPPPRRSFTIASRAARPCDTAANSTDTRTLGVAVNRIVIESADDTRRVVLHDDPHLTEGYSVAEPGWRWTTGRGVVPQRFFPDAAAVRVGVEFSTMNHRYRVGGSFDRAFNRIEAELRRRAGRLALSRLAGELEALGARIYLANYYLPIAIPGLKLAAWAYDAGVFRHAAELDAATLAQIRRNAELLRNADIVFSIADGISRGLAGEIGVPAERIVTTGIDVASGRPAGTEEAAAQIRQRYGIADEYVLCVGMVEPRQGHVRLVQAYQRVLQLTKAAPRLVILGKAGGGYQPVLREIEECGLAGRADVLTGVEPDDLPMLYDGALFAVYPSLYEGFRPPMLDAIANRTPILTARNSIMGEIAGEAAVLVDIDDVESIADGFARLAGDASLRAELLRRIDERRNADRWPAIARTVLDRLQILVAA
jgi:glycosyltransferase involved in cell wall biosynthesis